MLIEIVGIKRMGGFYKTKTYLHESLTQIRLFLTHKKAALSVCVAAVRRNHTQNILFCFKS